MDEDDNNRGWESDYFDETGNSVLEEYASYLTELCEEGSVQGFLGIVLVAERNRQQMVDRYTEFKEYCGDALSEKIVILNGPTINRDNDYSQELIEAIESLRIQPNEEESDSEEGSEEESEETKSDLNYIITNIDTSGSHRYRDFSRTFLGYYREYSTEECFNRVEEIFVEEGSNLEDAEFQLNAEFLVNGVGTNIILTSGGESWYQVVPLQIYRAAANLRNNWIKNCNIICKQRWTTSNNRYVIPLYGFFAERAGADPGGLDIDSGGIRTGEFGDEEYKEFLQYSDIQNVEEIYPVLQNKPVRSVNFPSGGSEFLNIEDRAPRNAFDYYFLERNYPNHPLAGNDLVYNRQSGQRMFSSRGSASSGNCPCYMLDPVKNYLQVISE